MKPLRLLVKIVLFIALAATSAPEHSDAAEGKGISAMQKAAESMQPGWNLGNTFDAPSETAWGNPVTSKELIERLAAEGFKSIRIPVTWDGHLGEGPEHAIDADYMSRVREVVDMALDTGLHVVLNMHHDSHWIGKMGTEREAVLAKFEAIWRQIAEEFKNEPDRLLFESVNEPRFSDDWNKDAPEYFAMLEELNVAFHRIVRESGGNNAKRPLVLSTLTASSTPTRIAELAKTIEKLKDDRLMATIHFYGFYPFSVNVAGATTFDDEARAQLESFFDLAYDEFVVKGIPVLVGEYGLLGFDKSYGTIEHGEIMKYFEYVGYYTREKKMTTMLWDNGQHFDRRGLRWNDPSLYAVMSAGWTGRSSTAESDTYFIRKGEPVRDSVLALDLNGNSFASLYAGERELAAGADYSVSEDELTLKSALLESLLTGQYGENAVLTAKFSSGADWAIRVILYDTPRLRGATGNVAAFAIPAEFNGDRVKALEAVYADGGNAGPAEWTPYQEYNLAFVPDYEKGELRLTPEFFKEAKDGDIRLKVHFWSGAAVEYSLNKSGDSVTGDSGSDPDREAAAGAGQQPEGETPPAENQPSESAPSSESSPASEPSPSSDVPPEKASSRSHHDWLYAVLSVTAAAVMLASWAAYYASSRKKR